MSLGNPDLERCFFFVFKDKLKLYFILNAAVILLYENNDFCTYPEFWLSGHVYRKILPNVSG